MKNQSLKTVISTLFLLFIVLVGLGSCEDENSSNREPNGNMVIDLTTSSQTVVLQQKFYDQVALDLTWTRGLTSITEFQLEIDLKENDFLRAYQIIKPVKEERKITFTHEVLNNIIREYWPTTDYEKARTFEMRINGLDNAKVVLQSAIVEVQITAYNSYEPVWIKGKAIGNLKDELKQVKFNQGSGKYEWEGYLYPEGGFIFGFYNNQATPAYIKGDSDGTVKIKENSEEPDKEFTVNEFNYYRIELDPDALTIGISATTIYKEGIWIVGNFNDWNYDNMPKLTQSPDNIHIYTYEGSFVHGQTFNLPVSQTYYEDDKRKRDRLMPVDWNDWGWGNLYHGVYEFNGNWIDAQFMPWNDYKETAEGQKWENVNGSMYNFWYGDGMDGVVKNFRITVDALNKKVSILELN